MKKSEREEIQRQARFHTDTANQNAERSHETNGEISHAYSSLSEAHYEMARALKIALAIGETVPTLIGIVT